MHVAFRVGRILRSRGLPPSSIQRIVATAPDDPAGAERWADRTLVLAGASEADPAWLAEAITRKDDMTMRDLAAHLGVAITELSAVFRAHGVQRTARGPASTEDSTTPFSRPGSKDALIEAHYELLGAVPDADIARLARVSVRTVASYRARHAIPGYEGPRRHPPPRGDRTSRVDDSLDLLGRVPDRVIAEIAGMSLGAIRNYRIKEGIAPAGRMPRREVQRQVGAWRRARLAQGERDPLTGIDSPTLAPIIDRLHGAVNATVQPVGLVAWQVWLVGDDEPFVVTAPSIAEALALAAAAAGGEDRVLGVEKVGTMLHAVK